MQTEEDKQFRLNPQALGMTAIAFLALALPVAMVFVAVKVLIPKKSALPPEAVAAASAPLQKSLEDMADKSLAPLALSDDQSHVELSTADPAAELRRIQGLASRFQAVTLSPSESEGETRLLVTVDQNRAGEFVRACRELSLEPTISSATTDQSRALIEIVIKKKSP